MTGILFVLSILFPGDPPTFHADVAPITLRSCAECHREGEAAPFALVTYADVRKRGRLVAQVSASRYMPPWLASCADEEFEGDRRLSEADIQTILQWLEGGMPEGDPAEAPPMPTWPTGWRLGTPDLVVTLPEPYTLDATGTDDFRNFVIPLTIESTRFVRAIELRPANPRVVHHAILNVDPTRSTRKVDAADPGPGFGGMTMGHSVPPDGHFLGWTPGRLVVESPPDMAWRLRPGTDLVLQLHLLPTGKTEIVRPRIGIHFTEAAPKRFPEPIVLYDETIDIPAGAKEHRIEERYRLPADVDLLGVYPHAHYLARRMRAWVRLPEGSEKELFRIDDWSFDWQDEYRYRQPIFLPRGTEIFMRYVYDNSAENVRNPHQPPRRVTFGQRSADEMGTLTLQVVPRASEGYHAIREARWRYRLRKTPTDAEAYNWLGIVLVQQGRYEEARQQLEKALDLRPEFPEALCNLGDSYRRAGHLREAAEAFAEAIRLRPGYAEALNDLGVVAEQMGREREAYDLYRRAQQADPNLAGAQSNLGTFLARRRRPEEALPYFRRAVELQPGSPQTQNNLATALLALEHYDEAIKHFRAAIELEPEFFNAHLNLGRALLLKGDRLEALRQLGTTVKRWPNEADARELLLQARKK